MAVFPRVLTAALLAAASLSAALGASGADLQWASYGSLTGSSPAFSIANDPGAPATVYAATLGSGLLRTSDGKSWGPLGASVLPKRLWRIAIDPARGPNNGPGPIYVGSAGQGFYKSLDSGANFQQLNNGLKSPGSQNVRAVALGRQTIVIGTSDGVFKSSDGGKTWQAMGLQGLDVSAVTFAQYSNPTVILAGIDGTKDAGSRLVRTVDLGANWIPLTQGIPGDLVVTAIAAGPVPSGQNLRPLFVAGSGGVYKSDDGGQGWAQLSGLPPQGFNTLATSAYDANIIYAASDGGGAGNGGVWRSTDRGGTWTALSGGLSEKSVTALTLGRNAPATLAVAAWNPDTPAAPAFVLNDTQAVPQGQPEGGVCPEPGTENQCTALSGGTPANVPSAFAPQNACTSPSSSPSITGTPSAAATSASPSPTSTNAPFGCATPTPGSDSPPQQGPDVPIVIALGVLAILAVVLVGRIFFTRR
ncbi:MAG: hypothetical protein M3O87_03405 [Candidatus Dormibacteraeota bacterium]|nr:hypothetical protein [Candidatus Dormibacteraeota bacterium]